METGSNRRRAWSVIACLGGALVLASHAGGCGGSGSDAPTGGSGGTGGSGTGGEAGAGGGSGTGGTDTTGSHVWSLRFGDPMVQAAREVVPGPDDSTYLLARVAGLVDFGAGSVGQQGSGAQTPVLVKLDAAGVAQWVFEFGDAFAFGLDVDTTGNAYVSGLVPSGVVANFGGNDLPNDADVFWLKLGPDGNHLGSAGYVGSVPLGEVGESHLAVDPLGGFVMAGSLNGTIDFGDGNRTSTDGETALRDFWLARFDADGVLDWSRAFGSMGSDQLAQDIAVDRNGNIYLLGYAGGDFDVDDDTAVSSSGAALFLVRFDSAANELATLVIHAAFDPALSLDITSADEIWVTGGVTGTVDFGGGALGLPAGSSPQAFLAKYDADLTHLGSAVFGGSGTHLGRDLDSTDDGGVSLIGSFVGGIDLGGGALDLGPGTNAFAAVFASDGQYRWSTGFPSVDASNTVARGARGERMATGVTTEGGLVYAITGLGDQDFGGDVLTHLGNGDAFIARLNP